MKKIIFLLAMGFLITGCQTKEKNSYEGIYRLEYYYLEGCSNCENFTKNALPLIKEEFGDHMQIIMYNMDSNEGFDEMKNAYDHVISQINDFDRDDYGKSPFLVLEGYFAQLGVSDVNKYLDNLIAVINDQQLKKANKDEKYYYFKEVYE